MNQACFVKRGIGKTLLCRLFPVAGLNIIFVKGALIHRVVIKEKTVVGLFMHHMAASGNTVHLQACCKRQAITKHNLKNPTRFGPVVSHCINSHHDNSTDESLFCFKDTFQTNSTVAICFLLLHEKVITGLLLTHCNNCACSKGVQGTSKLLKHTLENLHNTLGS